MFSQSSLNLPSFPFFFFLSALELKRFLLLVFQITDRVFGIFSNLLSLCSSSLVLLCIF